MAQNKPGELFGVGQFRIGDELDHRLLCRAADLHAGFDRQPLAHGAHIETGVVEQAIETQDAALDVQFLAIGIEAAVARTNRAVRPWQVASLGGDPEIADQAAGKTCSVEQEMAAEVGADVEFDFRA